MNRYVRSAIVCLVILVVNAAIILLGRSGLFVVLVYERMITFVGLPLLLCALAVYLAARRTKYRRVKTIALYATLVAVVMFSTILSAPFASKVGEYDAREARSLCEALVPKLERTRAKTGSYPTDIDRELQEMPWPQRQLVAYGSDGESFDLQVYDPNTFFDRWCYLGQGTNWDYH